MTIRVVEMPAALREVLIAKEVARRAAQARYDEAIAVCCAALGLPNIPTTVVDLNQGRFEIEEPDTVES